MLLAGVLLLVFVGAVVAAVAPGVFDEDDRPGSVSTSIQEVDLEAGEVSGGSAELVSITRLWSDSDVEEDVRLVVRATSTETGLLEDESNVSVDRLHGGRETEVRVPVVVDRMGGYELDVVLYIDDDRASERTVRVSGVGSLTPAHLESDVGFHDFYGLPSTEFSVSDAAGGSVDLEVSTYLSNSGDSSEEVEVRVKARQAESNILASEARGEVTVQPTTTEAVDATLTVPDGYNYYLDAEIWSNGNVVDTHRTVANLDPTREIDVNVTERDVGLEIEDFEEDEELRRLREERQRLAEQRDSEPDEAQPGFGVAAALAALLAFAAAVKVAGGGRR